LITARTATNTTACGTGVVSDHDGGFAVEIERTPLCASSRTGSRGVTYYVIARGERAGSASPAPFLDAPGGGTRRVNLSGTEIPGCQWTPPAGELALPLVRFYGDVTAGRVPAPGSTEITVIVEHSATDMPVCGMGTVVDELGTYWVDVLPLEDRATSRTRGRGLAYRLLVGGEVAGSSSPAPFFDNPGSLAGTRRVNLRVMQLPPPPPPDGTSSDEE
jgi:hypothetical protein